PDGVQAAPPSSTLPYGKVDRALAASWAATMRSHSSLALTSASARLMPEAISLSTRWTYLAARLRAASDFLEASEGRSRHLTRRALAILCRPSWRCSTTLAARPMWEEPGAAT